MSEQQLLTREQVATMLGVDKRTLDRMVQRKEFPKPIRFNRKLIRWKEKDVEGHLSSLNAG